ncbi:hypothetical protein [Thalassotalea sp. G2M2-11]|uniref:hypothetical protein n=1 Tax=Thalassotalea sp. G2M2-11 TaxID=2787627 RepID=UPI0019CF7D9D|nr:hypothetical protein [Thalassotalea sp. G2M2-11]
MDSSTPFYQQLNARFYALLFILVGLLGAIFSLFVFQEQQHSQFTQQTLPKYIQVENEAATQYRIRLLMAQLAQHKTADLLQADYQKLIAELTKLAESDSTNKRQLTRLLSQLQPQQESITRLAENKERNALLRDNALIQLQLVLDEFKSIRKELASQQGKLYQQIVQDKVNDAITTSRVNAYAKVSAQLEKVNTTLFAVEQVYVLFNRISLQYLLEDFDYYNRLLAEAIALWHQQFDSQTKQPQYVTLLNTLEKLLYSEQSVMAKWRGQVRLAQEFVLGLDNILQRLPAPPVSNGDEKIQPMGLAALITSFIPSSASFTHQQVKLILGLLLSVLTLFVVWLLLSMRARIKRYDEATLGIVEQQLTGSEEKIPAQSALQQQMLRLLAQVSTPKYSEDDYLALRATIEQQALQLFEQASTVLFSSTQKQLSEQMRSLLFSQQIHQPSAQNMPQCLHWRHAFLKQDLHEVLAEVRQAKADQQLLEKSLTTRSGTEIKLILQYYHDAWHGVVINNELQNQLTDKLQQVEQSLQLQQVQQEQALHRLGQQLAQMTVRAMLQNQKSSVGGNDSSLQVARQLYRILDWCQQLQVSHIELEQMKVDGLCDVSLPDELFAFIHNISQFTSVRRNKVQYYQDPILIEQGRINPFLFHQVLMRLAKLALQDTLNADVVIRATVVDKNAGQQLVKISIEAQAEQNTCTVPNDLKALVNSTREGENNYSAIHYLQLLLQVNHADDLQLIESEQCFELNFTLPITLIGHKKLTTIQAPDLKEATIVAFSQNKRLTAQLKSLVSQANGRFDSVQSIEHLNKLLTNHHLKRQPIAAIIIGPECYSAECHVIAQQLNNLAKPIRPKLMVLQSLFNNRLAKYGLFADTHLVATPSGFYQGLTKLVKGSAQDNLLVSAEVFKQYRFSQTQTEVLIGVSEPVKQQALSKIIQWLGFQPYIVCEPESLLHLWQSGRYVILINQLALSPWVKLAVGNNIKRGVFSLKHAGHTQQQSKGHKDFPHWQSGEIDNVLDIDHLVKLLSPWLKESYGEKTVAVIAPTAVGDKKEPVKTSAKPPKNNAEKIEQVTPIHPVDRQKLTNEYEQAFDLINYARHQGSPELAVFMLEEYLQDISDALEQLQKGWESKDTKQVLHYNEVINRTARILSAAALVEVTEQLSQALAKKSVRQASKGVQPMIETLQSAHQTLVDFAQAI